MSEIEKIDFKRSMSSQNVRWVGSNLFSKYFCFLLPLIFIIIILTISIIRIDEISRNGIPDALLIISPIMFLLSALSLRAIIRNNKFVKIKLGCSLTEARITLKKEIEQSGWKVNRSNVKYLTAHKTGFWLPGSKIAILFNNDVAYINVQNIYGIGAYFPFSFGRNKQYATIISQVIKDCKETILSK